MAIPMQRTKQRAMLSLRFGAYISLHTGAGGGTNGANEATGGGYARVQTTWTPGSTGTNSGSVVNISCAAGTYTEGGIWSALTTGTFVGSAAFWRR